eukprot:TRINITY_DN35032_c0_g1_i1.p1 TRINITY_DN35032_c0_g1~~TRINITY_DN35032_c0_g1_i1.p1  ORF type:complete len:555 (-),score=82.77 TRINITY_DN35032_c0_g1_i1:16-1680(-)
MSELEGYDDDFDDDGHFTFLLRKIKKHKNLFIFVGVLFLVCVVVTSLSVNYVLASDLGVAGLDDDMLAGMLLSWVPVYAIGIVSGLALHHVIIRREKKFGYRSLYAKPEDGPPQPPSHWLPNVERRGLGDAIESVNHIALIVEDVGRSLSFYTDVMGFQQIRRPNFDRHGAWLTVGNTELHLIKGKPVVHSGEDLIVSHIALDTKRPLEVLEKLIEWDIPFRQNVSVPDPIKARANRKEDFSSSEGKVTQFFVRDPDGYYLEICNCDILTKFCLMREDKMRKSMAKHGSVYYKEGVPTEEKLRVTMYILVKCIGVFRLGKRRVRENLAKGFRKLLEEEIVKYNVKRAARVDKHRYNALLNRRNTYTDITQGFSEEEIKEALLMAGNHVRIAILILKVHRDDERVCHPPSYFLASDDLGHKPADGSLKPRPFPLGIVRTGSNGSLDGLVKNCKPFCDRGPSAKAQDAKQKMDDTFHIDQFRDRMRMLAPELATLCTPSAAKGTDTESPTTCGATPDDAMSVHSFATEDLYNAVEEQLNAVPGAVGGQFDSVLPGK